MLKIQKFLDESSSTHSRLWRWILAGPISLFLSILIMATLPLIMPGGAGGVNNLLLPVLLFPLLWAVCSIWPVAVDRLSKCILVYSGLIVFCMIILTLKFTF